MSGFFKKFGKGLLYLLVLPVFIIVLAGYAIYGFIIFIFVFIRSIIDFFKGKSFFRDLPEDIEAKKRLSKVGNVFTNQEKKEAETIVVMEAGDVTPKTIEVNEHTPIAIEDHTSDNSTNEDDYITIEDEEEIKEIETFPNEQDEIVIKEDEENEEEILPEDNADDDHFF